MAQAEARPATRAFTVGLVTVALVALASLVAPWLPGGPVRDDADEAVDVERFVPQGALVMQRLYELQAPDDASARATAGGASEGPIWARVYHDGTTGGFEIVDGSRRLHAETGARFVILDRVPMLGDEIDFFPNLGRSSGEDQKDEAASAGASSQPPSDAPDTDVTGDGVPEVLVAEWTGGAHCCFNLHVFQLRPTFRMQRIEAEHSEVGLFVQADDDAALELRMPDWTFAYWKTGFARSPAPEMVLKFDGREWHVSAALMRQSMPEQAALVESKARWGQWSVNASGDWGGPGGEAPWGALLDLIYTGHAEQARQMLDDVWTADEAHKRAFWQDLVQRLRQSPAWTALVELNGAAIQG